VAKSKKRSTPERRTLILWALLVQENAAAFQNELKPEPEKTDRDTLKDEGLITWEKRGRRIWIEVTDKGWAWAGRNLDAALPASSGAGSQILQSWLTRLKAFMGARGFVLADVLGPQNSGQAAAGPVSAPSPSTSFDYGAVRKRIRDAYFDVTSGRFNARALLSDIRLRLKNIDRTTVDDALRRMHVEDGTTLSGLNNPQEITPAIRDAGVNFKGESMYVLWITK
jgi:hypothetical protein